MIYGYARVSTVKQMKNGNSIDEHKAKLIEAGAQEIITDSYTGTKMERPNFTALLERLQPGDKLIVTKLDRFARTAVEGGAIVKALHEKGVTIHILNMGIADNTPMGRLMVTMLLAFAEFERDMIVERTSMGKAHKREHDPDWKEGRKSKEIDPVAFEKFAQKQKDGEMTVDDCCRGLGISRSTWYDRIRKAV